MGIALFAVSMMDAGLIGADKPLAYLLAVIPAVVATLLFFMAPVLEEASSPCISQPMSLP